jgi:hypothetical protein
MKGGTGKRQAGSLSHLAGGSDSQAVGLGQGMVRRWRSKLSGNAAGWRDRRPWKKLGADAPGRFGWRTAQSGGGTSFAPAAVETVAGREATAGRPPHSMTLREFVQANEQGVAGGWGAVRRRSATQRLAGFSFPWAEAARLPS